MGQLFKSFKRYRIRTSNFLSCLCLPQIGLNSTNIYSDDSIMTGMKISIIFVAVAVINVPANAVPLSHEECEEKFKECEIKVGNKAPNGTFVMSIKYDQECVQEVDLECPGIDYTKLRNTLVKKFKEDAEELIYEYGDIKSIQ